MGDKIQLVGDLASGAVQKYSASAILRAAVASTGPIGAAIDGALSTIGANLLEARLMAFADAVREECASIREGALRTDFLETEAWVDAVHRATEAAARTADREMITSYAKILVNSTLGPTPLAPDASILIATLAELSPIEIAIARVIWNDGNSISYEEGQPPYQVSVVPGTWEKVALRFPEAAKPNLVFHLKRLERSGLISEITGTYGGGAMYGPTPTLGRIIRALQGAKA